MFEATAYSTRAIHRARQVIETAPHSKAAQTLSSLILSLDAGVQFATKDLYLLEPEYFELALQILRDWRLDRYYVSDAKVFALQREDQELSAAL
jgi:hypothetical protein